MNGTGLDIRKYLFSQRTLNEWNRIGHQEVLILTEDT